MAVQATLAWEEEGCHPRAQRGPVAGAETQFSLAPSIGVFGLVPVWARSIFSSSCVVVRAWCLVSGVRRRCFWRRCYASAYGVRGMQGCVLARGGAALWLRLLLRRRVCCDSRGVGRACRGGWRVRARRLRGARAGRKVGVRLASCRSCGRGAVPLLGRCACAPLFLCSRCRRCRRRSPAPRSRPCPRGALCVFMARCRRPAWHELLRKPLPDYAQCRTQRRFRGDSGIPALFCEPERIPGIFAQNLPLWSLRPSLTVGMTKIPKIPGSFQYFFCSNLRNLPTESSSKTFASCTDFA